MSKVNVGIIGCGGIHPVHVAGIQECPDATLVAVCDNKPERVEKFSKEYGVPGYLDYKDLLKDDNVQAVHISTPHYTHAEIAIAAMKAGKAVLLEKPMAIRLADALQLVETQKSTGAYMGVCFQNRYRPLVERLYKMVNEGQLGKIKGVRSFLTWSRNEDYYTLSGWRGNWQTEGGSLLTNQAIHTMDLLQWIFGGEKGITGVRGSVAHHHFGNAIETEDTAELVIEMDDRLKVLFFGSNGHCEDSFVMIDVVAEKAHVRLEDVLTVQWNDGRTEVFEEELAGGEKSYWGNGHSPYIKDYYRRYLEKKPFPIDVNEGLKTVRLLDMIYNSPNINHCR